MSGVCITGCVEGNMKMFFKIPIKTTGQTLIMFLFNDSMVTLVVVKEMKIKCQCLMFCITHETKKSVLNFI